MTLQMWTYRLWGGIIKSPYFPVFYRNLIENGWVGMVPPFNCHHFALFSILLLSFRV